MNSQETNYSVCSLKKELSIDDVNRIMYNREKNEEGRNMSILIAGEYNKNVFMISDSRSSNMNKEILNDNWEKIRYFPKSNIIIGVVGKNAIKNVNVLNLIQDEYDLHFAESKSVNDFLMNVSERLNSKRDTPGDIILYVVYYLKNKPVISQVYIRQDLPISINTNFMDNSFYINGPTEICKLTDYFSENIKEKNFAQRVKYFSDVIKTAIDFEHDHNKFSNIGGHIQCICANQNRIITLDEQLRL